VRNDDPDEESMILREATIQGFKSIKNPLELVLDARVTVLLGANDHGKCNVIEALTHLNADKPFVDDDANWDLSAPFDNYPRLVCRFELSDGEKKELLANWLSSLTAQEGKLKATASGSQPVDLAADAGPPAQPTARESEALGPEAFVPSHVTVSLQGVWGALIYSETRDKPFDTVLKQWLDKHLPRVEVINPFSVIRDSVTADEIVQEANEFMQGVFFEADLDYRSSGSLFTQNDKTTRSLDDASERLDHDLSESWAQGRDAGLHFKLRHNNGKIELQLKDPALTSTYVRASRRSSGFTHFFAMNMVLKARRKKYPASSNILLFDEPGIYLHPAGQRDLLQVLEALAQDGQIVYSTHSMFMINRNYPARHRLILKDDAGTRLDGKPFTSQWKAALDALGLSLPGTILFAHEVLLCEGDSDPIYLHAILQMLIRYDLTDIDINGFSAMATQNSETAAIHIEQLTSASARCKLGLLFDGDQGGREREKELRALIEKHSIPVHFLPENNTIEDNVPFPRGCFAPAVADYCYRIARAKSLNVKETVEQCRDAFSRNFQEKFPTMGAEVGVWQWAESATKDILGMEEAPSKVGVAREYVDRLVQYTNARLAIADPAEIERSRSLAVSIKSKLSLPSRIASKQILAGETGA
jgi:hypothetical protein